MDDHIVETSRGPFLVTGARYSPNGVYCEYCGKDAGWHIEIIFAESGFGFWRACHSCKIEIERRIENKGNKNRPWYVKLWRWLRGEL